LRGAVGALSRRFAWPGRLILWAALGFVCTSASHAGEVLKSDMPAWVQQADIPAVRPERLRQTTGGLYYLLADTQISTDGKLENYFHRSVYKITDREGLEDGGRLQVEFDPSDEDLVLHRVRILRNGAVIDQLRDAKIQVLQREEDLDNGVVTGRKTVHLEMDDAHVGDIVDLAYSWQRHPKLWPGQFFGTVKTSWSVPVGFARYRLIWPSDKPLTIRNLATTATPTRTTSGGQTTYEWTVKDSDPVPEEGGTPKSFEQWGRIGLSSMSSWGDVVQTTLPLYADKVTLSPELAARADQIARRFAKPDDRITEALRLVQDNLRYVSMSIGKGSYVPRDPADVFRSGYGDCKDKAQLLVALLRHMGIEAYTALTDTEKGPSLPQQAPAPTLFDHAIVEVKVHGKTYWLEPTRPHQGGRFPNLDGIDYRWALPLAPGQKTLEPIPAPGAPRPTFVSTETYDVPSDAHAPLALHVVTEYDDGDADWMRENIASKSTSEIERDYLKYYANSYPGITTAKPLRFTDSRDRNRVLAYEEYLLPAKFLYAKKFNQKFFVRASSLNDYDDKPDDDRRTPYTLPYPINKRHIIVLNTPGHQPPAPQAVSIVDPGFRYRLTVQRNGDQLTLNYALEGIKEVLGPKEIATYRDDIDAVKDDNYWYLDLTSNAGGSIDDTTASDTVAGILSPTAAIAALVGLIALLVAMIFGLRRGLHADDAYAREAYFYPVDMNKFVLMSIITVHAYSFFWMWKCWRWVRTDKASEILPFWRAFFGIFWLYPLFSEVNSRTKISALTRIVGIGAAALYLMWSVVAEVAAFSHKHTLGLILGGVIAGMLVLPTVASVNRLNSPESAARAANSKWTWLTMMAVAGGLLNWAFVIWTASKAGFPI
jgi:transglutaminase-like putative cysteine protease